MLSILALAQTNPQALVPSTTSNVYTFNVTLPSGPSTFDVEVHPEWAPLGAERFKELASSQFFEGVRFFRVVSGFMCQFGISGDPSVAAQWREKRMNDDPSVGQTNARGTVTFATSGENSRTTQMFINLVDNANLDDQGFTPFATVRGDGMSMVDQIESVYGEGAPSGNGPDQGRIQQEGNDYLMKDFPKLSYINSVRPAA